MEQTVRLVLGGDENPTTLASHDWLMPGTTPAAWHQNQIRSGALINGAWAVDVKQAGEYEITLHRWPAYLEKAMEATSARILIGGIDEQLDVEKTATGAKFKVRLEAGPTMLQTWLTRADGKEHGAYFAKVRFLAE